MELPSMTDALAIFQEYHHCNDPKPSSADPNGWGGILCLSCGFEVFVTNWLEPGVSEARAEE